MDFQAGGQGNFGGGRLQGLDMFDPITGLLLQRFATKSVTVNFAQEGVEGGGTFANGLFGFFVGLVGESNDEIGQLRILGGPSKLYVFQP